jgi:uncharacterized protein YjiS (DUF1127 family)
MTTVSAVSTSTDFSRGFFSGLRARMARRAVYNRTVKELSALPDHLLSDIGVSRLDIDRVARDTARQM